MTLLTNRSRKTGLALVILLSVSFISLSTVLIVSSSSSRADLAEHVDNISVVSQITSDLNTITDTLYNSDESVWRECIQNLDNSAEALEGMSGAESVNNKVLRISEYSSETSELDPFVLSEMAVDAKVESQAFVLSERVQLGEISEQLNNYWDYSQIMIGTACVLAIIGALLVLSIFRARKTIDVQRSRNRELFANSQDAIIICDTDGMITDVNNSAQSMLGFSAKELNNNSIETLYASLDDRKKVFESLNKDEVFRGNITNQRKDGSLITVRLTANNIKDHNGNIVGTMGISRDITDEVALEEQYEDIVTNASDVIYSTNFKGEFTYVNPTFETKVGYNADEVLGKNFEMVISDDDKDKVRDHYQDHFKNLKSSSYLEFRIKTRDGEELWVGQQVKSRFNLLDKNRIEGFTGVARDMHATKKAQLMLAESEERYRELFDNSTDLIQSISPKGEFIYVNNSWKNILGFAESELDQMNLFDIIHDESKSHCLDLISQIIENGECPTGKVRYSLLKKSGDKIIVEGSISVKLNGSGELESIQTFLRDVTAMVESQELLEKQERTLRQITETLSDVFYLYNIEESKYEYISPNCEDILGTSSDFFYQGNSYTDTFCHPNFRDELLKAKETVDSGEAYEIEYLVQVNGQDKWINEKSFPIRNGGGEVIYNSGICRDISDYKEAQEIIVHQNKEITDSINYAKRIQDSILADQEEMDKVLDESFVYYQPKDILSGDFYVVDTIHDDGDKQRAAFIVGDCTGHGVPGGALSLLCSGLLKESFSNEMVTTPAAALDYVRIKLVQLFSSDSGRHIKDGMDVTFCILDNENLTLTFASANRPCVILRKGEIIDYRGDAQHVGFNDNPKPFTNHVVDVEKGDLIVLFSDGYVDQFGGPKNRKFMRTRFYEILLENENKEMPEIRDALSKELNDWKGEKEQTDDIVVFGVRV